MRALPARSPRPLPLVTAALVAVAGCRSADPAPAPAATAPPAAGGAPPAAAPGAAPDPAPAEAAPPRPADIVLVRVDGEPLTLADALETFSSSHTGHDMLVQGEPALRELAGRLVERRLFDAEAAALGIPDDPDLAAAVEERRAAVAETHFWRRAVEDRVSVSDEEVEAFYAKTDLALKLTLVEVGERALALDLRRRAEAGEDLAELAREHSTDGSATFDGVLPFVRRGELDPALEEPAFALAEPGALSPVVATAGGFAFVRLEERIQNTMRPERAVAIPQIRSILEERAEEDLRAEVEARLEEQAEVRTDESRLTRAALLAEDEPEAVAVRSAGETLTLGELRAGLDPDAVRAASDEQVAEAAQELARDWALEQAARAAAREQGLFDDPEVLAAAQAYRRELIQGALFGRYVYADVEVGPEQVRDYYERHKDTEFTRPAELRVAYIVVATEEEARSVLARLEQGESFRDLAVERSLDSSSALHGGRIGWIRPGQLLEAVEEPVFAAEVDAVVGPIATEVGHFVVHVMERKEAVPLSFEVSRGAAERRALIEQRDAARRRWQERLRERAAVEFDAEGLRQAVAWCEAAAAERAAQATDEGGGSGHGHGDAPAAGEPPPAPLVEPPPVIPPAAGGAQDGPGGPDEPRGRVEGGRP